MFNFSTIKIYRLYCLADLRNVFRADNDLNKQRKKATPTSTEILKKLSFSCKWEGVEGLFTEKTSVELNSLSNHIRKGQSTFPRNLRITHLIVTTIHCFSLSSSFFGLSQRAAAEEMHLQKVLHY